MFSKSLVLGWTWIPKLDSGTKYLLKSLLSSFNLPAVTFTDIPSSNASAVWWSANNSRRISAQIWGFLAPGSWFLSLFFGIFLFNFQILWPLNPRSSQSASSWMSSVLQHFTRWEVPSGQKLCSCGSHLVCFPDFKDHVPFSFCKFSVILPVLLQLFYFWFLNCSFCFLVQSLKLWLADYR